MPDRTVLITGGNRGIGFEAARRLKQLGYRIIISARDHAKGSAAAEKLGIDSVVMDVTQTASVSRAATEIRQHFGRIDILINNAGILGPMRPTDELTGDDAETVLATNVVGVVRVIHAFLPLLRCSHAPVIVNVSSGMGSFGNVHDADRLEAQAHVPIYSVSKAALTMLTTRYAKTLPNIRVNAVDPGYTATDFTHYLGTQTVKEGTDAIIALATIPAEGPSGIFADRHGPVRW